MKQSPNKLLALSLALPLMLGASACGATLWVDGVLNAPASASGLPLASITDQSNATGWDVTLEGTETLTLTWNTPFFNDGTGQIVVNTKPNITPMPVGSGFDVRFLLADDSYSSSYTVAAGSAVTFVDFDAKRNVSKQAFSIADVYSGPLAIKGVEFTNLNPYDASDGQGVLNRPYYLYSVNAVVPVPEASTSLLALGGMVLLAGRRRR